MRNRIGTILVSLMSLALLGYTAIRTYDLIQITLPESQKMVGYLALVAFDGGILGWLVFYLGGAKGSWQRAIALIMTFISLLGVILSFAADTIYQVQTMGVVDAKPDPGFVVTIILAMALIIGVNITAFVLLHLFSPNALKAQAEEEAQGQIEDSALEMIRNQASRLASEIAPKIGSAWVDNQRARYADVVRGISVSGNPVAVEPKQLPSGTDLSNWSVYAVTRALVEQHNMTPGEAFLAAHILINGKKPSPLSDAQLRARMNRPKTIPHIDDVTAQQAQKLLTSA